MTANALGPRLVVGGTHSGVGKTTVATGLLAALQRAGHTPAGAKVGPDFIDPGYHSLASGRPPRNLDAWLCGAEVIPALAGRAAAGADVLIVEGVMGLFDGSADGTLSSTADVARLLDAPVVLVVDAGAMSGSSSTSSCFVTSHESSNDPGIASFVKPSTFSLRRSP
jgi:cobyrinic acid a,c-diamide synthase